MVLATYDEALREYAHNAGMDDPERAWILTPWDVWMPNPFYTGPAVRHPEYDEEDFMGPPAKVVTYEGDGVFSDGSTDEIPF